NDDRDHDANHDHRRHLVDRPIEPAAALVAVLRKRPAPATEKTMHTAEYDDQAGLQPNPALAEIDNAEPNGQPQPERPAGDHRRRGDAAVKPSLHHLEGFRLLRASWRRRVVDEQPWQVEH